MYAAGDETSPGTLGEKRSKRKMENTKENLAAQRADQEA